MANEATVLVEAAGLHDVTYYTIADGTAVPKGTLMVLSESATRTVVIHSAAAPYPVGFAVSQKAANDGYTSIGVQRTGLVEAVADDTVDEGDAIIPGEATANQVQTIDVGPPSGVLLGSIMGQALQAATAGDKFLMRLRL